MSQKFVLLMVLAGSIIGFNNIVYATDIFTKKRSEGWHWYEDRRQQQEIIDKDQAQPELPKETASQRLQKLRQEIQLKLDAAIDNPSSENLESYMLVQRRLMDKSQNFAENWQRVLYTKPYLDETITNPVNQAANHIYLDQQKESRFNKIKGLSAEYGLIFLYKGNCPYCRNFAPLAKKFAEKYKWSVMAISLDSKFLPEFPVSKNNNGIAEKLGIDVVPALIAIHPSTGKVIPLAYGMVSESEIEDRVNLLVNDELKPWESR
jgi:conjugal transfer pilus assembly protein TraF